MSTSLHTVTGSPYELMSLAAVKHEPVSRPQPVRVIAVTSGKGGVGKTNVSVNLSIALAAKGQRVMLLDADLGLGNVDVLLGVKPRYNVSHVLDGECELDDIIVPGPRNIMLLPAASGVQSMTELSAGECAGLIHAFSNLSVSVDTLVVDTAAGASSSVTTFAKAAEEIVVVVCDEPASITDAYALIKLLNRSYGCHRFRILANMARTASDAKELFLKLTRVTDRFLTVSLDFMGFVPFDDCVHKSVQRQRAVVDAFPRSKAALAFKKIANVTDRWPVPHDTHGQLGFFVERAIDSGHGTMEV